MQKNPFSSRKKNKRAPLSRRTLSIILLAAALAAAAICYLFVRNVAVLGVVTAFLLLAAFVTLPVIFPKKKKSRFYTPPRQNARRRRDKGKSKGKGWDAPPFDAQRGKIIQFPGGRQNTQKH